MKRSQFKFISAALMLVLLFALGGTLQAQDVTEVQMTWWGSQNRHDRTIEVINLYMAEHPDVNLVYQFANFDDYWVQLNTAAAGSLPCIMQHDYAYLAEWAGRDLLAPLDPYVEQGLIDLSDVSDNYVAGGRVDGELYGLSLGTNSQSMILDLDAFEAAGVELPAPDWTWADFEQTALALHEALDIWGYGSPTVGDDQIWTGMYNALGMSPFNAEGTALGYTDDQPLIGLFEMILRLQEAGAMPTPEEEAEFEGGPENSPIVFGRSAMQYQWSNQVVAIFAAAGEERNFKLWQMPRPEGAAAANYLKPSMFFSIPASCETPEIAADFINYFTNSLEANEVLFAERGVPISSAVREHLMPMLDAVGAETFDFLERVEADSSPIFPPNPPGYNDIRNNIYIPLFRDPVRYGQLSVEEGVAIFRSEAEALLSQNS